MKKDAHPQYYPEAKIACACGQTFIFGDTKPSIKVNICSHCHPFFTGKDEFIDVAGRVEKFNIRRQKSISGRPTKKKKQRKQAKKTVAKNKKG